MKEHIVIDLDGTLCDVSHRADYAKAKQWDDFHSRCLLDKPFMDVVELLERVGPNVNIIAATGRNERFREPTIRWINKNGILIDDLLMRPDDNFDQDAILKINLLESFFGDKEKVLAGVAFCLDDREQVVEAFRNYGLACWQVRPSEY